MTIKIRIFTRDCGLRLKNNSDTQKHVANHTVHKNARQEQNAFLAQIVTDKWVFYYKCQVWKLMTLKPQWERQPWQSTELEVQELSNFLISQRLQTRIREKRSCFCLRSKKLHSADSEDTEYCQRLYRKKPILERGKKVLICLICLSISNIWKNQKFGGPTSTVNKGLLLHF